MGLFGSIFKGIGKVVGGVAKVAVGAVKSGLLPIPGGGLIGKAAGLLLNAKRPMATTSIKLGTRDPRIMRGNATAQMGYGAYSTPQFGYRPPPAVLRLSPVMPGGAVATPSGVVARGAAPAGFGGRAGAPAKRRRKRAASTRSTRSTRSTGKRRGRKLKFGSPAWRKKYLGHGRKKRRRAA